MNPLLKIAITAALILLTIIFGLFLHKTGKPYSTALLTVHKLLTVGFAVFITLMVVQVFKVSATDALFTGMMVCSAVSLVLLLASGGLLSVDKWHDMMLCVHRIATIVFVVSVAMMMYKFKV
jgi:hypothetical protein